MCMNVWKGCWSVVCPHLFIPLTSLLCDPRFPPTSPLKPLPQRPPVSENCDLPRLIRWDDYEELPQPEKIPMKSLILVRETERGQGLVQLFIFTVSCCCFH